MQSRQSDSAKQSVAGTVKRTIVFWLLHDTAVLGEVHSWHVRHGHVSPLLGTESPSKKRFKLGANVLPLIPSAVACRGNITTNQNELHGIKVTDAIDLDEATRSGARAWLDRLACRTCQDFEALKRPHPFWRQLSFCA